MRWSIALLALCAMPAALAEPVPQPLDVHVDVPQDNGPQHVNVLTREFPVGGSSGWHVHPGVEIAWLQSGEMELHEAGKPVRRLQAGDHFVMPRGVAHNGVNIGAEPALVVITYVVDKGAPLRSAVPAPHVH